MSKHMIGVDVGGTFTDVFVLNEEAGTASVAKVPTTRPDQSGGFLDGIRREVQDLSEDFRGRAWHDRRHQRAPRTQGGEDRRDLCTEGLRDVLEMRRRDRPRTWGLRGDFEPIVDRRNRLEVPERTLADGSIRSEVDLDAVRCSRAAIAGRRVRGGGNFVCQRLCQPCE